MAPLIVANRHIHRWPRISNELLKFSHSSIYLINGNRKIRAAEIDIEFDNDDDDELFF